MTTPTAEYLEATDPPSPESVPLSHLSIELGHFYHEEFSNGDGFFRDHFRRIVPWYEAARAFYAGTVTGGKKPRISTCLLIDDYFIQPDSPCGVLKRLVGAAWDHGLAIDYVVRESACAEPDGVSWAGPADTHKVSWARLVESRIVEEPPRETTGARPPVSKSGWLCNGQRSPATSVGEAMRIPRPWAPPAQNVARNHSIFMDVELRNEGEKGRQWSCSFLSGVWQLLRMGVLRDDEGRGVAEPRRLSDAYPPDLAELPEAWHLVPPILQLNPTAAPFTAYRTFSILDPVFFPIEDAVRTILSQVTVDPRVLAQIEHRSKQDGVHLPRTVVERIEYLFVNSRSQQERAVPD